MPTGLYLGDLGCVCGTKLKLQPYPEKLDASFSKPQALGRSRQERPHSGLEQLLIADPTCPPPLFLKKGPHERTHLSWGPGALNRPRAGSLLIHLALAWSLHPGSDLSLVLGHTGG